MTPNNLPEPLRCPDTWKYSDAWQKNYEKKNGLDYLSEKCEHSLAQFYIVNSYINGSGQTALDKIKKQNLIIKRLHSGTVDPTEVSDYDVDGWHTTWAKLNEQREEVFAVYNAQKAPLDILEILDEVKAFMNEGQLHCQSLLQYLVNARAELEQKEEMEREQEIQQERANKWDLIDVEHSHVTEGFIYLLSNTLMPGVYKIGFTAGNPDRRARDVSVHYGLPMPFELIEYWRTTDPYIVEQRIHTALASYMKGGEFFEVDLEIAKQTIEGCLLKARAI